MTAPCSYQPPTRRPHQGGHPEGPLPTQLTQKAVREQTKALLQGQRGRRCQREDGQVRPFPRRLLVTSRCEAATKAGPQPQPTAPPSSNVVGDSSRPTGASDPWTAQATQAAGWSARTPSGKHSYRGHGAGSGPTTQAFLPSALLPGTSTLSTAEATAPPCPLHPSRGLGSGNALGERGGGARGCQQEWGASLAASRKGVRTTRRERSLPRAGDRATPPLPAFQGDPTGGGSGPGGGDRQWDPLLGSEAVGPPPDTVRSRAERRLHDGPLGPHTGHRTGGDSPHVQGRGRRGGTGAQEKGQS